MNFGDNLKRIRQIRKMSQEELAHRLGVSRQSVSKWETGENYPSMSNIMALCTIFKCQINELVHEDMTDINSLDDDVKLSVVKFKEEKQKKVKLLSKIIAILSRAGWIASIVGIAFVLLTAIIVPISIKDMEIVDNKISTQNNIVDIIDEEDKLVLKVDRFIIADETNKQSIATIKDVVNSYINDKGILIAYCEAAFITLMICLILAVLMFKRLEKLFININRGDTPFTLDNVEHIKKIAYILIALIIIPNAGGLLSEVVLNKDLDVSFEIFNVIEILIIFVIAYIFEYGYEIQLDSKGKMYGEENE